MPDQRIDQLNAETTPAAADVLPVFSIAGSDTKKITVKNLVQVGAGLVDDASIPVAKVNLSGISGTNLSAGTVAASKLDTSTIPVSGGVTVSSSNLQLVAPTSPIVRNAGTGSLEHAVSGATAGTYTKVTVDTKGHVTTGTTLVGADVPVATSSVIGGVSIPAAGGLALTGGGALSHSNSVAGGASTRSGITYDLQGHITSTAALVAADMPIATTAALGAVIAGTGLAVDGNGILSTSVATTSDLGGIKIGSEFGLNGSNQLLLATQANVAGGTAYPKVTVNSKGVVTAGATLDAADIPNLDARLQLVALILRVLQPIQSQVQN
jgi:trimeric autotransporter adhesin